MILPRILSKKLGRIQVRRGSLSASSLAPILMPAATNAVRGVLVCVATSLCVCSASLSATPAHTVSYHGIPLQVESRREVGPGTLQLSVRGESFVIAEAEAGRGVLLRLLASSSADFTPTLVRSVAGRAAQIPDREVLEAALAVIFLHKEWTEFDAPSAWQDVAASEVGRAHLVSALNKAVEATITEAVCSSVRALFEFPPTLQVERLATQVAPECKKFGAYRAIREVFRGGDLKVATQDVERLAIIFEDESPTKQRSPREVSAAIASLQSALEKSDASQFERAILSLSEIGKELAVQEVDRESTRLREQFVVQAVKQGSVRSALAVLPTIKSDKRTPELHMAVLRVLDALGAEEIGDVLTPDAQVALRVFAEKDEEIAVRYQTAVRRGVESCLRDAKLEDAFRLLSGALTAQGVLPSQLAPAGLQVVRAFLSKSDSNRADEVAQSLNVRPGIFLALRLALARVGLSLEHVFLVVLLLIATVAAWRTRRRKQLREQPHTYGERVGNTQAGSSREGAAPVTHGYSKELTEALATFGLQPGASLSDIKNAYRARVKACHPDRTPHNASSENNDEFVRLTAEYDRLLILYRREVPDLGKGGKTSIEDVT